MEGISFTIKGDNFNKTVKTGKDGSVSVEGLFPGTSTVTEPVSYTHLFFWLAERAFQVSEEAFFKVFPVFSGTPG